VTRPELQTCISMCGFFLQYLKELCMTDKLLSLVSIIYLQKSTSDSEMVNLLHWLARPLLNTFKRDWIVNLTWCKYFLIWLQLWCVKSSYFIGQIRILWYQGHIKW